MGARFLLLLLLLLLGLSLLWGSLQALKCFKCDLFNASGICKSGESFCQAQGSQLCFLRKVYEGNRLLYGYQGCGDLCISMSLFGRDARVDFSCCSDTSFCNRL